MKQSDVTIPIPSVNRYRGRGDSRNMLCPVIHFSLETEQYKLGLDMDY